MARNFLGDIRFLDPNQNYLARIFVDRISNFCYWKTIWLKLLESEWWNTRVLAQKQFETGLVFWAFGLPLWKPTFSNMWYPKHLSYNSTQPILWVLTTVFNEMPIHIKEKEITKKFLYTSNLFQLLILQNRQTNKQYISITKLRSRLIKPS